MASLSSCADGCSFSEQTVHPFTPPVGEQTRILIHSRLFDGVSSAECGQLARDARARSFEHGDFLYQQGQPVRTLILLESGCVKLTQVSHDGSEVILWMRGSGDAVGFFGLPAVSTHTCSARVMVRGRGLIWDLPRLDRSPAIAQIRRNISYIQSERISELEERFREIATESAARRVALGLARIASQIGVPVEGGTAVFISREELAQLTGTTVFTVSRLISGWGDQGILRSRREAIVLRSVEEVRALGGTAENPRGAEKASEKR